MSTQIAQVGTLGRSPCYPYPEITENGLTRCGWPTGPSLEEQGDALDRRRRMLYAGAAVGVGLVAWIAWLALRRRPGRLQGLARRRRRRR